VQHEEGSPDAEQGVSLPALELGISLVFEEEGREKDPKNGA